MLDKLLKNKSLKNAFMLQFKKIIESENLKTIVITIDEGGEIKPILYKEEMKVITVDEYNKLINAIKSQL